MNNKKNSMKKNSLITVIALAFLFGGYALYKKKISTVGDGLYMSNGRIEAVEIYISTKYPGRIKDILVNEGEMVEKGQILAIMDSDVLKSQLEQAEALHRQAISQIAVAKSQVRLRESERNTAKAMVREKQVELGAAQKRLKRTESLVKGGASSRQQVDDDRARVEGLKVAVEATKSKIASADAAIAAAKSNVISAESATESATASVETLKTQMKDSSLKAPRAGRIQYRIAQPGEVLGSGGRVVNLLDLTDVYMNFFLPTKEIGTLRLGEEARIVLDALPGYVIRSKISFISDEAQFTPKTVETKNEREKLMFRVRARISRELLAKHINSVKTGLPGVVYIKTNDLAEWPEFLNKNLQ